MFSIPLLLLLQSIFWSLRLGSGGNSFPRALNSADEARLLKAAATGDKFAREQLIEHNLRLVAHICKKYFSKADQDDLISIGTIGLIKAIDTYNISRSTKLATYAARCIENEILMQFRKEKKGQTDVSLNNLLETGDDDGGLSLLDTLASDSDLLEELDLKENCV
ncbi:MAG: sigma-70 family RNA polymerase sigma factor, partial [Oscillospiraceae bacterium]|nr:sigma-70 family RNA polymerase sigma factor [Oscillospiraceae bacterium]